MTRPVCEITGRYLAEQKSPASARSRLVERKSGCVVQPSSREDGQAHPGTNSDWAQLARAVIAQEMAFRGGVR